MKIRSLLGKIVALLSVCALLLGVFPACGHVGTEAEIMDAAQQIFFHMTWVSNALYGEGISAEKPESGVYGVAVGVPDFLGGDTVLKFKEYLQKIFSVELYRIVDGSVFESVKSDSGTVVSYARYYDYLTDEGKSYFMVNTNYKPFVLGRMEFDKESIAFVSASPNRAVVSIDVTVTYTPEGGETVVQKHPALEMELAYEGGAWKLDTPPYMNYDPEWK
jgi:hypothetical protein